MTGSKRDFAADLSDAVDTLGTITDPTPHIIGILARELGTRWPANRDDILDGLLNAAIANGLAPSAVIGAIADGLTPAGNRQGDDDKPRRWAATELKPAAQPRWLARNRIPRGAVSLLIGDEGIGKSLLWVLIVAAVTTGKEMPEFGIPARAPARVLIAAITEDDWQTVVRPRLEVAGADLDRSR